MLMGLRVKEVEGRKESENEDDDPIPPHHFLVNAKAMDLVLKLVEHFTFSSEPKPFFFQVCYLKVHNLFSTVTSVARQLLIARFGHAV